MSEITPQLALTGVTAKTIVGWANELSDADINYRLSVAMIELALKVKIGDVALTGFDVVAGYRKFGAASPVEYTAAVVLTEPELNDVVDVSIGIPFNSTANPLEDLIYGDHKIELTFRGEDLTAEIKLEDLLLEVEDFRVPMINIDAPTLVLPQAVVPEVPPEVVPEP